MAIDIVETIKQIERRNEQIERQLVWLGGNWEQKLLAKELVIKQRYLINVLKEELL
ncbi:hypothetical protein HHOHNEGG_00025 [Clostridium phage LPCPA6]|uniref:Uncharacterized protein n=1 Tax=Clostridium phage LPCPA6 TaxID=2924884 RepID=A0AAE9G5M0_9CAUD|nr:hypothetical protein PQC33_gp25 [Clostridium phage LPCPA6]UNY47202.1 hypothetical protein HHOHNEGG_00025 [Clostridium phage LPCPA6]